MQPTATTLHEAILAGLATAASLGLTKPDDISTAIQVAIKAAGLRITKAPKRQEPSR